MVILGLTLIKPYIMAMADTSLPCYRFPLAAETSGWRKVRKGTQSCWECKRRKVRCTFAPPRGVTCDGCKRRSILCVSQEFPQSSTRQVGDRLGRVEALVEQLVKSADTSGMDLPPRQRQGLQGPNPNGVSTPASSDLGVPVLDELGQEIVVRVTSTILSPTLLTPPKHDPDPEHPAGTKSPLRPPSSPTVFVPAPSTQPAGQHEELCPALLAAWPSARDLDTILSIPVEITGYLHGLICTPYSSAPSQKAPSPREMLQLPPPGSHPVLVARKLLILGSYLQAVPPCGIQSLGRLGVSHRDIMSCAVDTVHSLVNCNDELVTSIEGIECITIESMYHNNAGNLRRSWLTMRRAMLVAQMMGLHRGRNPPSMKTLERQTCIRPEHIWFRLVQSDRYLSLMLGLPQGATESGFFATTSALESCTPTERLQRIDCDVAGRILQRNEADINDLAATQEIDKLLHKAAMCVPPQWWLIPSLASSASDKMEHFHETIRLMDQFTHYHLLARLHLPYLLRTLADRKYEYSKTTAVNASREVLARFVAFRCSNPIGSYCRGIDFLAFIASTTLCLAHIETRRQGRVFAGDGDGDGDGGFFVNSLVHQRPSDRGMMERALESLERMASASPDMIGSKIATILRHLLVIEADAADGSSYNTSSSASGEEGLDCGGRLSDGGSVLRIYIPCFGAIKIERSGVSRSMPPDEIPTTSESEASSADPGFSFSTSPLPERQDKHTRQPLNMLDCPTRYSIGDQSVNTECQGVPWRFDPLVPPQHSASATNNQSISSFHGDGVQAAQPLILGLEGGAEDWALQGVDTALFDNLIRGSELNAAGVSYGTQ